MTGSNLADQHSRTYQSTGELDEVMFNVNTHIHDQLMFIKSKFHNIGSH